MRKITALFCALLIIPLSGSVSRSGLPTKTKLLAPPQSAEQSDTYTRASALYRRGDYSQASSLFARVYDEATIRGDALGAARSLWYVANCHFAQGQYHEAQRLY